jgi:hypothetical protein
MKQESSSPKKRVSFLMPYIDFCFMLIIIFVGMLSIAYFEPLGKTDIETKKTNVINQREGKFEINPVGLQVSKTGVGEVIKENNTKPLVGRNGSITKLLPATRPGAKPAAAAAQGNQAATGADLKPKSYVNPEELENLKKELQKQKDEIEKLKATQKEGTGGDQPPSTGQGDNYYIDLRSK